MTIFAVFTNLLKTNGPYVDQNPVIIRWTAFVLGEGLGLEVRHELHLVKVRKILLLVRMSENVWTAHKVLICIDILNSWDVRACVCVCL